MLPYYLLLLLVAVLGFVLCERRGSRRNDLIYLCVVTAVMILMASLRADTVGIDYKMYANYFQSVANHDLSYLISAENPYRIEFGFSLLNYLVSLVTNHTYVFMAVVAVLTIGLRADRKSVV